MFKPALKSAAIVILAAFWYPAILATKKLNKQDYADRMIVWCNRAFLSVIGITLTVRGDISEKRPLLMVSNHISYLDILLLASQLPVRFTPKSDIARWPIIGSICRLCDVVFIDRRPGMVKAMQEKLHQNLKAGKVISLFPEATTGDGIHLEPFKPGLFSLASHDFGDGMKLAIQPVAITYTRIRRLPIDRTQWPHIAWYGDMELVSHLLHLLSIGPMEAELVFLPPIDTDRYPDRKQLAAACQEAIEQEIEHIRARRPAVNKPVAIAASQPALRIKNS